MKVLAAVLQMVSLTAAEEIVTQDRVGFAPALI